MAKRFIDTGLFDDEWFSSLSSGAKLGWLYLITKCDHAGIISLNKALFKFQTGNSWETVSKELSNSYVTLQNGKIFIQKFLDFQYPNFPQSKAPQQLGAIELLKKNNIWDNSKQTVTLLLPNSNSIEKEREKEKEVVMEIEKEEKNEKKIFVEILDYLNSRCLTNYRTTSEKNCKLIRFRLNEGFTSDDFKYVIDVKVNEWLGTDMEKYLRPETLFGTKFENYRNQKMNNYGTKQQQQPTISPVEQKKNNLRHMDGRSTEFVEKITGSEFFRDQE